MKYKYYLVIVLMMSLACLKPAVGQSKYSIDDPDAKYGGFSIIQTTNGTGFGGYFEWSLNASNRLIASLHWLIVRGKNDYPIYDPYYDPYGYYAFERYDKTRLNLLPVQLGYKRILFVDKLANNFRPFLHLSAGPVIAIDPPNIPDFSDRMKNIKIFFTTAVSIGAGIDFSYQPGTLISLFVGYDYLKFNHKIDKPEEFIIPDEYDASDFYTGRKNFNGLVVKIGIGKKF